MNQKRLHSKVVWVAILAQVVLIIGLYQPEISDQVKIIGGAIIEALTVLGILNNPTNKTGF